MSTLAAAQMTALWLYVTREAKAGNQLNAEQLRDSLWLACQEHYDRLELQDLSMGLTPTQEEARRELADFLYPVPQPGDIT